MTNIMHSLEETQRLMRLDVDSDNDRPFALHRERVDRIVREHKDGEAAKRMSSGFAKWREWICGGGKER